MKFTFSWLKEYLATDASPQQICESLTNIGLEVESFEDQAKSLSYFSVAKILEAKNHENSAKLKICQVEVAQGVVLQIICGAANARAGIKVAYAPIGAVIPANQMVIKKAKIAGVESNGMLCSAAELGLGDADEGIIEIDEKFLVGTKITDIYGKNDAVIEINVTPNRGDCLGVYGIARDLAALGLGALQKLPIKKSAAQFPFELSVKNEAVDACNFAAFRVIKNIKNCESPKWLKEKLAAIGVNSISAVVDVTNYVMLCLNRPMHAYDASKIKGSLDIRFAKNGEKFLSLKKEEFILDEKMLVVADSEKAQGVAGVIGSIDSACELTTTEIILEAAYFDAVLVAQTGRKLNILTDSRYRFERGVDMASCEEGIDFATQLITEICGGEVSEIKLVDGKKIASKKIEFDLTRIKKLTGLEVPTDKALQILQKLEFVVEKISDDKYLVTVPTHRHDVTIAQDLVEEVVRIFGYNKIQPQKLEVAALKSSTDILDQARHLLVAKGMIENINWSFCDHNLVEIFAEKKDQLMLANPISSDLDHMRPNLLIGLIQSYQKNSLRGFVDISSFEIGKVFLGVEEKSQKLMISGVRAGKNKEQNHYNDQRDFDIFDVKKDLFDVVELFGLKAASLQIDDSQAPKYYHPHRSAALKLGKNIVGYFGEIHPKIAKKFDLKNAINAFEIFVETLPQAKVIARKSYSANDLQPIERDFAFLVDKSQAIGDLVKTIENCDKQLIKQVDIFDIYSGKNIAEGKKSVALRAVIQPLEKSLTSEEIDVISKKIIEAVLKNCGAVLRG
jgi:phenylalanyl-tRNA synthetase beta chain